MEIPFADFAETVAAPVVISLGPVERIPPGEGREFTIAGEGIAVFRTRAGRLYAVQAKCPHREGPLADGIIGGGKVICPLHAFKFELESGQPVGNECAALRTYQVSLGEGGEILLSL
ncbi:MAG TPA: Rieske 2Fe-2S domain-containing protein [Blastocatellia bacterium]|nr:Rieske 2Fe-2S domain-containing protein [Blastocatellia bacterium]